jgi:hypothetical protein
MQHIASERHRSIVHGVKKTDRIDNRLSTTDGVGQVTLFSARVFYIDWWGEIVAWTASVVLTSYFYYSPDSTPTVKSGGNSGDLEQWTDV